MNNSKWKELIAEITCDSNFNPSVCIKSIFEEKNTGFSPVWWNEVERDGFELIEWLKINPFKEEYQGKLVDKKKTDYTIFIKNALEKCQIPFEIDEGVFVIYGYKRANSA